MDARTNIESRLPSRRVTAGLAHAAHSLVLASNASTNGALHPPTSANKIAEIFKKTPCAAGLKPGGQYVAKDLYEVGAIPLLMKTLLDNGHADGDCVTVMGQTIAENLKSVKPITAAGGVVGPKGYLAPEGAIVEVAGMLQDGDIEIDGEVRTSNANLSDARRAGHETKWEFRATNHTAGARWKAVDGAVIYPGGAHEKQCYADI